MPVYDWDTFKRYHGGINGARFYFENLMEEILRLKYPNQNVQGVKLSQGDGGIDVFVGNIGVEDIDVYQCKYFDGKLENSHWQQITNSFDRAKNNEKYTMKKWVLCIPKELTVDENIKWSDWVKEHKDSSIIISLKNGNEILNELENFGLCDKYFKNELPQFISNRPGGSSRFICREGDVNQLECLLKENDNILISGLGGYGKTSLATLLFNKVKDEYNHIGWINYEDNLYDSILNSLTIYTDTQFGREERMELICNFLRQQNANTLLFIDNVDAKFESDEYADLLYGSVKVVVTSRINKIENYKNIPIRTESAEECIDIFNLYYEHDIETIELNELVRYLEYNPLLIELVAKTAQYAEMSLSEYVQSLINDGFEEVEDNVYSNYDRKTDTLLNRIIQLYDMQNLDINKKRILQNFALTPDVPLPFAYRKWGGFDKNEIVNLINMGWIEKTGAFYNMHPLIKESILRQGDIEINVCTKLIETLSDGKIWNLIEGYESSLMKLQIAQSLIKYFLPAHYAEMKDVIGNYYTTCNELSKYNEAIYVLKQELDLYEKQEPENIKMIMTWNLALAYSYFHACKIHESIEYLSVVDFLADSLELDDYHLFEIYNLHTILEFHHKDADNAQQYFDRICKLKICDADFLIAVTNLMSGFIECNKSELALEYMKRYMQSIEEEFKEKESYLATFYSNLAIVYSNLNDFEMALKYDTKAFEIRKRVLGTVNKDLAITYMSLADDYFHCRDFERAKEYILAAEDICRVIFEDTNSQLYQNVIRAKKLAGLY